MTGQKNIPGPCSSNNDKSREAKGAGLTHIMQFKNKGAKPEKMIHKQ
jgi:hypothetical protein